MTAVFQEIATDGKKSGLKEKWLSTLPSPQPFPPEYLFTNSLEFPIVRSYCDAFFLRQKYLEEGLSTRQIAALIFSSRSTISVHLKKFGIPLRPEDISHKMNKGQLGYGEKRRAGQEAVHQREAAIIEKMKTLRAQGHSYWKIADILNAMKIPTKTRRAGWKAATVMKILKSDEVSESTNAALRHNG